MPLKPTIVWFRNDLRLSDNPALYRATERGAPVVPVFIHAPDEEAPWAPGAASNLYLHGSLAALQEQLESYNSRLIIRSGASLQVLLDLLRETDADAIYMNRRYEPHLAQWDATIIQTLEASAAKVCTFNANLLLEPAAFLNKQGNPYQVFTPFYRNALGLDDGALPLPHPNAIPAPLKWPKGESVGHLGLLPHSDWTAGIREAWTPGEYAARSQLEAFMENGLEEYTEGRDFPGRTAVSRLSTALHFGEISPRQVLRTLQHFAGIAKCDAQAEAYMRQLYWREFGHYLLHHFPHTQQAPLQKKFADFPWRENAELLQAWQSGKTGYPLVDAGMRELWHCGWMHNRVRMVAASFLVKHLLQPWQSGAAWFWDTLVDADLANNTLGWQWVAGCGADAAPYFRIFNPVTQGKKFDPKGDYVRRWVPELAALPDKWIHQPWVAPGAVLAQAGITLGGNYPPPIVDHCEARERALAAYAQIKGTQ